MRYFLLIYFNDKPVHVSSRLAAHHQEDQLYINSNWYSHALCWLAAGRNAGCRFLLLLLLLYLERLENIRLRQE